MPSDPPAGSAALLTPFVPRLVIEWLRDEPATRYRSIDGTAVFADISGFTALTERLARRGKAGAEEVGQVLNAVFEDLFAAVYEYGATLIKWGGDAMLLLFDGEGHTERACKGAWEMQRVMARIGRVRTSAGWNHLKMSMGLHRGSYEFMLVGSRFRELVITGPAASEVARMEKMAEATQIVMSPDTFTYLRDSGTAFAVEPMDAGYLLTREPDAVRKAITKDAGDGVDIGVAFSDPIREYLLSGVLEVEHRSAAVAFVRASGADELRRTQGPEALTDAVERFINACQEAAAAHQVTCFASDVYEDGLKLMLVSGAPSSSGDDEMRVLTATRRALDFEHRLPVHAGVNVGRLVTGEFGPSYRRTYSIMGDCVNLAARLMSKAQGGEMVASAEVLDRSRLHFDTVPLPPFLVKGKSKPVEAAVVGHPAMSMPGAARSRLPLIGRETELAHLVEAANAAASGQGRVIELVGPAGIGKSRLLQEMATQVSCPEYWTEGDVYNAHTPYAPFVRLIRACLGLPDDVPADQVAQRLQTALSEQAPHLQSWLPLLGVLVGATFAMTSTVRAIDPQYRQSELHRVTSELLAVLLDGPTVLVFNDVDFMDDASRLLLVRLAADVSTRPWLMVLAQRDTSTAEDFGPDIERMVLHPLDLAASAAYLQAASATAPLLPHRKEELLKRAGGNPLFLAELISSAGTSDSTELPDTVEQVMAARIDRLNARQRSLLRCIAVLGMSIEIDLLEEMLHLDAGHRAVALSLDGLEDFVEVRGDRRVGFAHDLIRVTAYEGLSFQRRAVLHSHAATAILHRAPDTTAVAHLLSLHCFVAERHEEAWRYSLIAGDMAKAAFAMADAADFYQRALVAGTRLGSVHPLELISVCESIADTADALGEYSQAEAPLRRARRLSGQEPLRLAQLRLKTAVIRERTGQLSVAKRWLSSGLKSIAHDESVEAIRIRADLISRYARLLTMQGRYKEAADWATRGLSEAQQGGYPAAQARCLEFLDWAETALGIGDEDWPATRALAIYEDLENFYGQAGAHNTLGARSYYLGRWPASITHYQAAEASYRRCGHVLGAGVPMASRGEILSDQGRLEEAETVLAESLEIFRSGRFDAEVGWANYLLGRVRSRRGDHEGALDIYEESRHLFTTLGSATDLFVIDVLSAECRFQAGMFDQARQEADRAVGRMATIDGSALMEPLLLRVRGQSALGLGDADMGRADLLSSLDCAVRRGAIHESAFTLRVLVQSGLHGSQSELAQWSSDYKGAASGLGLVDAGVPA